MHSERGRGPGYGDLLAALMALRPDTATARFDEVLATLVAEQRIDPEAARELRWWQRESLRAVGDFLGDTAPGLLAELAASQLSAHEATAAAADAWARANRPAAPPAAPPPAASEPTGALQPDAEAPSADLPSADLPSADLSSGDAPSPEAPGVGDGTGSPTEAVPSGHAEVGTEPPPTSEPAPPAVVIDLRTPGGAAGGPAPAPPLALHTRTPHTRTLGGLDVAPPAPAAPATLASGRQRLLLRAPTLSDPSRGT